MLKNDDSNKNGNDYEMVSHFSDLCGKLTPQDVVDVITLVTDLVYGDSTQPGAKRTSPSPEAGLFDSGKAGAGRCEGAYLST